MFLILSSIVIVLFLVFGALKFNRQMDWDEPAESSPDFGAMRKKQAELQHIQDVLNEAREKGKLSQGLVDEFDRYCEKEFAEMKSVETAWQKKRSQRTIPDGKN